MQLDRPLDPVTRETLGGEFKALSPTAPERLAAFTSAQLVAGGKFDAAKWPRCAVWNLTLGTICVSNGSFWYPVTLGAHL